jgi:nucleotide-binding universal stress UspA family protein
MFKHILIPTDGSAASRAAINAGIRFAKETGAKVTGLHVCPEFHVLSYQVEMLDDTRERFSKDRMAHATKYLAEIESEAKEAGVKCETLSVISDDPYEVIVKTAQDNHCDIVVMASHGRKGIKGVLLGSETHKVLTHSKIPVLVYR